jgi:hypothetical protein
MIVCRATNAIISKNVGGKCDECDTFQQLIGRAHKKARWKEVSELKEGRAEHEKESGEWKTVETKEMLQGRNKPGEVNVMSTDDTIAAEMPEFSNNEPKSGRAVGLCHADVCFAVQRRSKLSWNPALWIDHSRGVAYYFLTFKDRYPKGANEYCTHMFHMLRALKVPHLRPSH